MAKDVVDVEANRQGPSPSTIFKLVVFVLILFYAVLFILKNSKRVQISFVFFTVESRAWVGFIAALILGAILGGLVGWVRRRGRD